MLLCRYWIKFDLTEMENPPIEIQPGCGVTAYSYEDALELVRDRIFDGEEIPRVVSMIENVDVSTLDKNHVLPNMAAPTRRGVWFPMGYAD